MSWPVRKLEWIWSGLRPKLGCFLGLLALVSILLRFTLRDRWAPIAPFYYASPWPVIAAFCAGAAILWRKFSTLWSILAWLIVAGWGANSSYERRPIESTEGLRLMFWNVSHPQHPSPVLTNEILELKPDIAALVEIEDDNFTPTAQAAYQNKLPDYQFAQLGAGMLCMAKEKMEIVSQAKPLDDHSRLAIVKATHQGRAYHVLVVDVGADVLYDRGPAIRMVLETAARYPQSFILGDFNTPFSSVHFDPYRKEMTHAFEASGQGLLETWPITLPLLSLDHIWLSKDLRPLQTRKRYHWMSDHAMLIADIAPANSIIVASQ